MDEATARTLVQAIIGDITDRRGFRQVWADTDVDTRQEVVDDLVKVVLQYAPKEEPSGEGGVRCVFPLGCTVRDSNGNEGEVVGIRYIAAGDWRVMVRAAGQDWPMEPSRLQRVSDSPELTASEIRQRAAAVLLKEAEKSPVSGERVDAARILLETVGR